MGKGGPGDQLSVCRNEQRLKAGNRGVAGMNCQPCGAEMYSSKQSGADGNERTLDILVDQSQLPWTAKETIPKEAQITVREPCCRNTRHIVPRYVRVVEVQLHSACPVIQRIADLQRVGCESHFVIAFGIPPIRVQATPVAVGQNWRRLGHCHLQTGC